MPKFIVKPGNRIKHDGVMYEAGQEIEMTAEQAFEAAFALESPPLKSPPKEEKT